MGEVYELGSSAEVTATFTDKDGAAADPTTVTCKVRKPDGTLVDMTADVTTTARGAYVLRLALDMAGRWYVRFAGTGAIIAAREKVLTVENAVAV